MTAISLGTRRTTGSPRGLTARALLAYALGGALALLVVIQSTPPSLVVLPAGGLFVVIGIWMFRSERYEHTLAVLMVYLGAADGYLKLRTGSSVMTLGRDALLYAIVLGAMVRWIVRNEKASFPPMTGWILVFAGLVIAEMFNPGTGPLKHAFPAARPDLEFVPLFFFGYAVMRSRSRLRGFLMILLFVCAVNGVVSLLQFGETPAQVASWGPGYARLINGSTGGLSGRTFTDSSGKSRVRPMGLQSDAGGGGNTGMLGVAAAIALLGPLRRRRWLETLLIGVLAAGTVLAVVTSDGRGAVLASFAALFAYVGLSVVSKRLIPTLGGLVVGGIVTLLVISLLSGSGSSGGLSRYSTISPTKLSSTYGSSRGFTLSRIPTYARQFPLGAGLGSTGPASGVGRTTSSLDASTEFTYLLTDVGVLGFILLLGFHIRLLVLSVRRIRQFFDPQMRALLAALAAPLFGIFALYFGGPATTSSPESPYFWFIAGTLVYWFTKGLRGERQREIRAELPRIHPCV
jgi:hypothetical protein